MYNAKPLDWLGMAALVIMFGSAFMLIKISVQEYPPAVVAAGRITIAAILLVLVSILCTSIRQCILKNPSVGADVFLIFC